MYKLLICIIKPDVPKISENTLPLKIGLNLYTLNFNKHSENMYSGKDTCYTTNVFTDFIGTFMGNYWSGQKSFPYMKSYFPLNRRYFLEILQMIWKNGLAYNIS